MNVAGHNIDPVHPSSDQLNFLLLSHLYRPNRNVIPKTQHLLLWRHLGSALVRRWVAYPIAEEHTL